ncbi:MAG: transglycosylase SLT domain-containing protein [candidate division SR1 bacterium]|nr:transglycosylase SLT domain-containing protein [candidate division SR1 bacterium]
MKTLLVSSLISLTLLNSGFSYAPNNKIKEYDNTELKQIIAISDYKPRSIDLGISKISSNLEKIKEDEARKIEEQKKIEEENRLREEERNRQIEEEKQAKSKQEIATANKIASMRQQSVVKAPEPAVSTVVPAGDLQAYAKNRVCEVFGCDQWDAYYYIIDKESHWNYLAINKSSGAGGLCQALPFSKMATAGSDYTTNPNTQTEWCISYIQSRYKNPLGAKAFWIANYWF